jgi:hypothetical protein
VAPNGLNDTVLVSTINSNMMPVTARPQRDPVNNSAGISGTTSHLNRVVIRYTIPRQRKPAARLGLWANPAPPPLLTRTPSAADQLVGPA